MPSAWPTSTELTNYLTGLGFTAPSGVTVADEITGAVTQWESDVKWSPWLGSGSSTIYLDPTNSDVLLFPKPFCTVTEVKIGVNLPLSIAGTALTHGSGYWTLSLVPGDDTKPIIGLRFGAFATGDPQSIKATGMVGYQETIDQAVWNAVRDLAAVRIIKLAQIAAASSLSVGAAGALTEIKQENVTLKFSDSQASSTVARLLANYDATVLAYRLVV